MTVREWINEKKKTCTIKDIINHMEGLADYGAETYAEPLDKEYVAEDFEDANEDPWVKDILYCEKVVELLNDLINHIENFEDDKADEVLKTLGVNR